jgi:hypothetical protein
VYLLDVNCLMALGWPNHVHHFRMVQWFSAAGSADWATTAGAQAGFLRVSMNPAVTHTAVTFAEAQEVLSGLLSSGSHQVVSAPPPGEWPDWLTLRVQGHRQVTDASLVATAAAGGITLATLDAPVMDLADAAHRDLVFPVPF